MTLTLRLALLTLRLFSFLLAVLTRLTLLALTTWLFLARFVFAWGFNLGFGLNSLNRGLVLTWLARAATGARLGLRFRRIITFGGRGTGTQRVLKAWNLFVHQTFNIGKVFLVACRANHDRNTRAARTTRATNAVHVIFGVGRDVKVENMGHGRDIKSTGSHI